MSGLFDRVTVVFKGGHLDGTVEMPAMEVRMNVSPLHSSLVAICAAWGREHTKGRSAIGAVMLLPAVTTQEHIDRLIYHDQDVLNRYRIEAAELRDRHLHVKCTYLGTEVADVSKKDSE